MTAPVVRDAREADLDKLVTYEIEIARISFPENPIVDHDSHRGRLARALVDPQEGTFVAVSAGDSREVVGWAWVSVRDNFLTGERYANLRSLAVDERPDRTEVAQALVTFAEEFSTARGISQMVGRVHVANVPMRVVYRALGFHAEHLTMRKRWT